MLVSEALQRVLGVSFGQLFAAHGFDQGQVDKLGDLCSEQHVDVDVFVGVGEPLLPSHDVGDLHHPVIDHVTEVEGGPSVAPHYDKVVERFPLQSSENFVFEVFGELQ